MGQGSLGADSPGQSIDQAGLQLSDLRLGEGAGGQGAIELGLRPEQLLALAFGQVTELGELLLGGRPAGLGLGQLFAQGIVIGGRHNCLTSGATIIFH
jgi:hypothetical protein